MRPQRQGRTALRFKISDFDLEHGRDEGPHHGVYYQHLPSGEWINERQLPPEIRPWRPLRPATPHNMAGVPVQLEEGVTFWENGHWLVFARPMSRTEGGEVGSMHLSMRTVENDVRHDWREMQEIKNQLCGPEWEGLEIYPAESRKVDAANQFHLWCFPFHLPVGFRTGLLDEDVPEELRAVTEGAVQRPPRRF